MTDELDTADQECYVVDCENPADKGAYSYKVLKRYGVCEDHVSVVEDSRWVVLTGGR